MPDRNSHEEPKNNETKEKRQFIKETIVKPPRTRRQMAARAIALLFSAAFFGIIAAVTFAITAPFARRYLTDETTESPTVTVKMCIRDRVCIGIYIVYIDCADYFI